MAEVHIIGQLIGASGFPEKGLFCKWRLQHGNNWTVVAGLHEGQTQIDTPEYNETCYWCHPIDVHLATKGVQGWPQILVEVFHRDQFGRDELYGYGGTYIPTLPGHHHLILPCWRPAGSFREEFVQFFLGGGPALKDINVVYSGNDRSWLQTESMGKVTAELHIIHRNFQKYGVEFTAGQSAGSSIS